MAAPVAPRGTASRRSVDGGATTTPKPTPQGSTSKGVHHNGNGKGKGASSPGSNNQGNAPILTPTGGARVLNPPFDPRMRRVGSPLNLSNRIRRGWIQDKAGKNRVNFLYNPSQLDLSHSIDPNVQNPEHQADMEKNMAPDEKDVMDADYVSLNSTASVKLLYDRTYELFSPPGKNGEAGFGNTYGCWADVAAWYTYLGMFDNMPSSWENSVIAHVPRLVPSFLFIGLKMAYYGWVNSLSVTYTHWSQDMVPIRCAIDIGFQILPYDGSAPALGRATPLQTQANNKTAGGWAEDVANAAASFTGFLAPYTPDDAATDYAHLTGQN